MVESFFNLSLSSHLQDWSKKKVEAYTEGKKVSFPLAPMELSRFWPILARLGGSIKTSGLFKAATLLGVE